MLAEHLGELAVTALVALLAYLGKRELSRKDEDVKDAVKRLDDHIRECREHQERVADTLLEVHKSVARIEGQLNK